MTLVATQKYVFIFRNKMNIIKKIKHIFVLINTTEHVFSSENIRQFIQPILITSQYKVGIQLNYTTDV